MRWGRAKEGYLQIDHRASPGTKDIPGGMNYESATATCAHCCSIVVLRPDRTRVRGYCRKCDDFICDACVALRECNTFTKQLDDHLEDIHRTLGKI